MFARGERHLAALHQLNQVHAKARDHRRADLAGLQRLHSLLELWHVAARRSPAQVRTVYEIALANGGSDDGPPGPRGDGFYAAYFRDPDGNKLNAFVMGPGASE